jgi:uncharacterized membrane protein
MSRMHPLHPLLAHAPVACWTLVPLSDLAAACLHAASWPAAFFWQASALLAGTGVAGALLAATAGTLDYARASETAPRLVMTHASLMATALVLAAAGLFGRLGAGYAPVLPPPAWAIGLGVLAFLVMAVGAGFGGEMVYGRGIGVRRPDGDQT